jgi:hypothetical protein
MAAPKGNSYWKSRSKHGRDKLFATPDLLLESASSYFDWCDENPWKVTESISSSKDSTLKEKIVQKPYSKSGWYHYVGCSSSWLGEFKKTCSKDFLAVITEIEEFISNHQWEGATVGVFNANIIARTLGLSENTKVEQNNIVNPTLTSDQVDKLLDKL